MSCTSSGFLTAADARLKSRNDKVIYGEICAIEKQLIDAMCNCEGTAPLNVTIDGNTPLTSPNGISGITILDGGSQYIEGTPVVSAISVDGSGLDVTTIVDSSTGGVVGFDYISRGATYAVGDVIMVAHPTGASGVPFEGSVASVDVAGEVLGITIAVSGTDYQNTPRVKVIDPEGTGSGFVGAIVLGSNNTITDIPVVNGGRNYSANSAAIVVGDVQSGGSPAIISTQTEASTYTNLSVDPTYYYKVWAGLVEDTAVKLQIDTIQKNFTSLGYNFIIKVNPSTMDTLMYYISW